MADLKTLYDECGVGDHIKGGCKFLLVMPKKGYPARGFVNQFLLDASEYEKTYPKCEDSAIAHEIIMAEAEHGGYEIAIQIGEKMSKKLPWWISEKDHSKDIVERVEKIRGDIFVNLHHHDEFSIRDGLGNCSDLIKIQQSRRNPFCAITNHGNVGGWIKQYDQCRNNGMKSIFGIEMYVNDNRVTTDEDPVKFR